MPKYISRAGVLHPAKEKVALKNKTNRPFEYKGETIQPGDPFIYEGPDRESINELARASGLEADPNKDIEDIQVTFGDDFRKDPEFLQATRTMGFTTPAAYLKSIGYDAKKEEERFQRNASIINKHELPQTHRENLIIGGGKDKSGGNQDVIGGFGDQRERKPVELKGK